MNDRVDLVRRFLADRTPANRDAVIAAHGYLCKRGARKFRRPSSESADLEQVAAIGLIKATDSYRPDRATPFEAYAWLVVIGELMHYVRDHERPVRIPRALRALERRYTNAWEALAARDHAEPSAQALADALDVGIGVIEQLQAIRRGNRLAESDGDSPLALLQCDALPAPGPTISLAERIAVRIAVEELTPREQTVVLGTFGAGLSQSEIAANLGLSQSQVSKILGRALGKLQSKVA